MIRDPICASYLPSMRRVERRGLSIERLDAFLFRVARNALVVQYRRAGVREGRLLELSSPDDREAALDTLRSELAEWIAPVSTLRNASTGRAPPE